MQFQTGASSSSFQVGDSSFLERLLFENRGVILLLCLLITVFLGYQARYLGLNASYKSVIPHDHPYIQNYLTHEKDLKGLGNTLRVVVENKSGSILDPHYLDTLRKVNDEIFALPGVERPYLQSLWTRSTRWLAVTEQGIDGGPVMPDAYDGSKASLEELRLNIMRSGEVGRLVASDFQSSAIIVPLLEYDAQVGQSLDYGQLSKQLEVIRAKYESDNVGIYIIGFAKVMGDLIDGLVEILIFFGVAIAIATVMVYWFTRCLRSTMLVVLCSLVAVLWLLGMLPLMGFHLDPYSILVPFLIFAIGMSHGAQKMNGVMQDVGRGLSKVDAARNTFRRLFMAGFTALVCDAVGFAVLFMVNIQAIRELALAASLGVAILIFTNLILLPILLTYTGVNRHAAERALRSEERALNGNSGPWGLLVRFTQRRWAFGAVCVASCLAIGGAILASQLKIGDLDAGAPELNPDSRYNRDNAYITTNYSTSSDVMAIMVTTADEQCADYDTVVAVRDLQGRLQQLPGVEATNSFADLVRQMGAAFNEGSFKWAEIVPNQVVLNTVMTQATRGLFNGDCNMLTVYAYLRDHKAETLQQAVEVVERFAAESNTKEVKFLLAAGNAGIEAATNQVVKKNNYLMLLGVYVAVIVLSLITFKSWRAVLVAILPLALTSILAEALMVLVGVGLKVSTLPVTALGVGIGIDYALYILSIMLLWLRMGYSLEEAYARSLMFVGRVVLLTGMTLAAGVATWMFSPIKFQADMGLLLAFMFLVNMFGALILLPSLAAFLLKPSKVAKEKVEADVRLKEKCEAV
ncbi:MULTISPECIES: MMPL family transporter [unclassified Pseudomonas]|uniref:efflux RND transporter permease subunit n=1 Tax=unclassified Pseudomonas TaxID=196821 RepID=UPI002457F225|nr:MULTISPECIES: MMPL family transporter [unclassified Pseudomonas]MDH4561303.1 RND family transporter [Pseudomonas sp. BN411]MDH4657005.1 RND family transporter [Pseudomonas sp. BN606]